VALRAAEAVAAYVERESAASWARCFVGVLFSAIFLLALVWCQRGLEDGVSGGDYLGFLGLTFVGTCLMTAFRPMAVVVVRWVTDKVSW